jgi:hypothetical protein
MSGGFAMTYFAWLIAHGLWRGTGLDIDGRKWEAADEKPDTREIGGLDAPGGDGAGDASPAPDSEQPVSPAMADGRPRGEMARGWLTPPHSLGAVHKAFFWK